MNIAICAPANPLLFDTVQYEGPCEGDSDAVKARAQA